MYILVLLGMQLGIFAAGLKENWHNKYERVVFIFLIWCALLAVFFACESMQQDYPCLQESGHYYKFLK